MPLAGEDLHTFDELFDHFKETLGECVLFHLFPVFDIIVDIFDLDRLRQVSVDHLVDDVLVLFRHLGLSVVELFGQVDTDQGVRVVLEDILEVPLCGSIL